MDGEQFRNATLSNTISDRFYLSTDATLDGGDRLLGTVAAGTNVPLLAGASYTQTASLTLPQDIALQAGAYRILVVTDALSQQFELNENDNFLASIPFNIALPGGPDLIVESITTATEVIAGQSIPIEWVVKNQGIASATGTWQDQVLISSDSTIGSDIAIGTFEFTGTLLPGQSISRTQVIAIPGNLSGSQKIVVRTDIANTIVSSQTKATTHRLTTVLSMYCTCGSKPDHRFNQCSSDRFFGS